MGKLAEKYPNLLIFLGTFVQGSYAVSRTNASGDKGVGQTEAIIVPILTYPVLEIITFFTKNKTNAIRYGTLVSGLLEASSQLSGCKDAKPETVAKIYLSALAVPALTFV
jgi:hypothetical protein